MTGLALPSHRREHLKRINLHFPLSSMVKLMDSEEASAFLCWALQASAMMATILFKAWKLALLCLMPANHRAFARCLLASEKESAKLCHTTNQSLTWGTQPLRSSSSSSLCTKTRRGASGCIHALTASLCTALMECFDKVEACIEAKALTSYLPHFVEYLRLRPWSTQASATTWRKTQAQNSHQKGNLVKCSI